MRAALAVALLCLSSTAAAVPIALSHSGFLIGANELPETRASGAFTFQLFAGATGGTPVWSSSSCTASVNAGYYAVVLGAGCNGTPALDDTHLPPGATRWLAITYEGVALEPRIRVEAAPAALVAARSLAMTDGTITGGTITNAAIDAASLAVAGAEVITSQGRLAGNAKYLAGSGISIDDATQTIALRGDCGDGEVLVSTAGGWACTSAPGASVLLQSATPGTAQVGHLNVTGTVRAGALVGDGSAITALDGAKISAATVPASALSSGSGNEGKILTAQASGAPVWADAPVGTGNTVNVVSTAAESVIVLANTLGAGTNGGSTVANAWTTLALNTELVDSANLVSLSANQFTLPDGSYVVEGEQAFGSHVNTDMQFRVRLFNVTDGATLATSTPCRAHIATGESTTFSCPLRGAFTLSGTKTIRLEYWANRALADVGLGLASADASGEPVRPTFLELRRLSGARCGATSASAAHSCGAVRNCGITTNATYWIDPDLNGPLPAFEAYCDLNTNGGGWMLVLRDRLNEQGIIRPTALTWSTTTLGVPSGDANYLIAQGHMESLPRQALNFQYLVVATGTGSTANQHLTCTQDEPITKNGAPANGWCTYQDGTTNTNGRRGISFHASGNCQNVSLWTDALNAGSWYQGSLHCETNCSCSASWATTFPAALGSPAFTNPGIPRTNNYTTWIFTR